VIVVDVVDRVWMRFFAGHRQVAQSAQSSRQMLVASRSNKISKMVFQKREPRPSEWFYTSLKMN